MSDKEISAALAGGKRTLLMRMARRLCQQQGIPVHGKKVKWMASALAGRPLGGTGAWAYLLQRYDGYDADRKPVRAPKSIGPRMKPPAAFYRSGEWREARFETLKKSNGCCCLCGRSARLHGVVIHVDHIKPRSLRPDLELDRNNLQVLCEDCNLGKSNRDDTDWRQGIPDKETPP